MIDIKFSSLQDTPRGRYENYIDLDRHSKKLREYHMLLWSKHIDSGHFFGLHPYLNGRMIHRSDSMEFILASDSIGHTYRKWDETKNHQVYLYGFFVLRHRHLQNAKRGRLEQNPSFSAKRNPQL